VACQVSHDAYSHVSSDLFAADGLCDNTIICAIVGWWHLSTESMVA